MAFVVQSFTTAAAVCLQIASQLLYVPHFFAFKTGLILHIKGWLMSEFLDDLWPSDIQSRFLLDPYFIALFSSKVTGWGTLVKQLLYHT